MYFLSNGNGTPVTTYNTFSGMNCVRKSGTACIPNLMKRSFKSAFNVHEVEWIFSLNSETNKTVDKFVAGTLT